jgi:hypothetical protein
VPATPPTPATLAPYTTNDAMGPYFVFWERAASVDRSAWPALFREIVVRSNPALFSAKVLSPGSTAADEEALAHALEGYFDAIEPHLPAIRRLDADVRASLDAYTRSFARVFPDFAWGGTVWFTPSLRTFDGALRPVGGREALLFGLDGIALFHGDGANLEPLFHHELFHVYHEEHAHLHEGDAQPLWVALWTEGLAVHVAHVLDPGASDDDLLLIDHLRERAGAVQGRLAREMTARLDEISPQADREFFLTSSGRPDIPARSGYWIGFLVAERVAHTRPLERLVSMRGADLRSAIAAALAEL